jgi:AcrR family transcriptional regulator
MPRHGLDSARVLDEAVRIADAEGLAAVTLARVAQALDVRAPSLYNHVSSRDALLRAIALRGMAELDDALRDAAVGRAGADALAAIARAYRDYARHHPGRYAATVRAPAPGDTELAARAARVVDLILAVLSSWGLDGEDAIHAVRGIRSALHGFTTIELDGGFGLPLDLDDSYERLIATLIAGIGASIPPSLGK